MKIKEGFVMREVAGQYVAIATGEASKTFHGMVKLNGTGAHIWQAIESGADFDGVVDSLASAYEVSREQASKDASAFIEKMKEQGLLE